MLFEKIKSFLAGALGSLGRSVNHGFVSESENRHKPDGIAGDSNAKNTYSDPKPMPKLTTEDDGVVLLRLSVLYTSEGCRQGHEKAKQKHQHQIKMS